MTEPTPTPEKQNSPRSADKDKKASSPERGTGFFGRVQRVLSEPTEPIHPSEAQEIVIMDGDDDQDQM
jgi:hypothetical protein